MADPGEPKNDLFASLLANHQSQLLGYILASLGNYNDSLDLVQRTNLTLCKKADQYRTDLPFLPWAFGVARFEILGFLRERNRQKVVFHSDVVELMSKEVVQSDAEVDQWHDRQIALHECLDSLNDRNRRIFLLRYAENLSLAKTAESQNKTVDSIKSLMLRIRRSLRECIEQKLAQT